MTARSARQSPHINPIETHQAHAPGGLAHTKERT